MRIYDIIQKKRDKGILNKDEIAFFINEYVKNNIPDYQISALLMAIYLNGMNKDEITILTDEMAHSGDMIDLSKFGNTVDKHSTGGVGDKTTLVVCPIVACFDTKIVKMSGRGLGFTGGTIDKLESIPGFKVELKNNELKKQVDDINLAIISQSGNITPADKKTYALRDATATVESIPLIASSIMSKKIAAGDSSILLDVKVGSGAFMKNIHDAKILATDMVNIGKGLNRNMMAILTNMDVPLGNNIGNALEVIEAIDTLKGKGPKDFTNLCIELAADMVCLSTNLNYKESQKQVIDVLNSGKALDKFKDLIKYQHGDINIINDYSLLPQAKYNLDIYSNRTGYITKMDTEKIGKVSSILGAGRNSKDDTIDYGAGIIVKAKINKYVNTKDTIATIYSNNKKSLDEASKLYIESITISKNKTRSKKLIYEKIG